MRSDFKFFCPIRVRYNEIDIQGIVYNGHYSIYMDVALEEFFVSKGYTYKKLVEEYDSEICHKKNTLEFNSSVFMGDEIEVGVRAVRIGERSFTLRFEFFRKNEDDVLVLGESVYVGYDVLNRCSRPLTNILKTILSE